jgi:hypothetical protein
MVATIFADKGQSSQHGKGRGTSSGQPWSFTAPASAPSAPMSYDEYRDMPCFAHRDALGKCNHTNRNCKFVNDIKADQEAGYKRNRRQRPRGKGKVDKDKESKDGSDTDEDPAPKPAEKAEGGASTGNPFKNTNKKEPFTRSLDPPRLRHSELLCAPSMPPCQKSASTSDGPKYRCARAATITQSTSRTDITPW